MTPEEKREIEEVIASAIERAFRDIGLDSGEVFELRRDLTFLREWRKSCELVRNRSIITFIGVTGMAFLAMLVAGVKGWITLP